MTAAEFLAGLDAEALRQWSLKLKYLNSWDAHEKSQAVLTDLASNLPELHRAVEIAEAVEWCEKDGSQWDLSVRAFPTNDGDAWWVGDPLGVYNERRYPTFLEAVHALRAKLAEKAETP